MDSVIFIVVGDCDKVLAHIFPSLLVWSQTNIELNLKNDRQIYLSHRQSVNRVKYLPVTGVRDLPPPCCVLEQDTLLPESTG